MYRHQQDGLTCRALVYEHMAREEVSEATAWRDWQQVREWNNEDLRQGKGIDGIPPRLSASQSSLRGQ